MAEGLILEFDGLTREHYDAVNALLGIDVVTRAGDLACGTPLPRRRREGRRLGRLRGLADP
jgi:hypothetical protein